MATVTYHNQPAIHKTRGSIPNTGTDIPYKVTKKLWPKQVERFLQDQLIGSTLHVCCGLSLLGDVRVDKYAKNVNAVIDAARVPFVDQSFDTVLCDPPYNSKFQWMHDMLNELHRLAKRRIIFQHWFSPVNDSGQFKKAHVFELSEVATVYVEDGESSAFGLTDQYAWMPRTYFGRMQIISIFDRI